MRPIVHGLEAEYGSCIEFVYLDIDDPATADARKQYNFQAQPLMILMDAQGTVLWKQFGGIKRDALQAKLKSALP